MTREPAGMDWRGGAFLIVANGVAPAMLAEYEAWHAFEHVPERLTMPGFLGGRRFARGRGPDRRFLTLYDLEDAAALESPDYRRLLAQPTAASLRMRPHISAFRRLVYRETARLGRGCGRHLGLLRWIAPGDGGDATIARLAALPGRAGVVSVRIGTSEPAAPHPAFAPDPSAAAHAAALVSGTDPAGLAAALAAVAAADADAMLERGVYDLIVSD